MTLGSVQWTTVTVSALISAAVAGFVTLVGNLLMGGTVEVAKRRATIRFDAQADLKAAVRVALNGVRILAGEAGKWSSAGNAVNRPPREFEDAYQEIHESYVGSRKHIAALDRVPPKTKIIATLVRAVGIDRVEPETTVGVALVAAGTFARRVRHFRREAIGYPDAALTANRQAMRDDLLAAEKVLLDARDCLTRSSPWRRVRVRRLRREVEKLDRLGPRATKTPGNYYSALQAVEPGKRFTRQGPYKDGVEEE